MKYLLTTLLAFVIALIVAVRVSKNREKLLSRHECFAEKFLSYMEDGETYLVRKNNATGNWEARIRNRYYDKEIQVPEEHFR